MIREERHLTGRCWWRLETWPRVGMRARMTTRRVVSLSAASLTGSCLGADSDGVIGCDGGRLPVLNPLITLHERGDGEC